MSTTPQEGAVYDVQEERSEFLAGELDKIVRKIRHGRYLGESTPFEAAVMQDIEAVLRRLRQVR